MRSGGVPALSSNIKANSKLQSLNVHQLVLNQHVLAQQVLPKCSFFTESTANADVPLWDFTTFWAFPCFEVAKSWNPGDFATCTVHPSMVILRYLELCPVLADVVPRPASIHGCGGQSGSIRSDLEQWSYLLGRISDWFQAYLFGLAESVLEAAVLVAPTRCYVPWLSKGSRPPHWRSNPAGHLHRHRGQRMRNFPWPRRLRSNTLRQRDKAMPWDDKRVNGKTLTLPMDCVH